MPSLRLPILALFLLGCSGSVDIEPGTSSTGTSSSSSSSSSSGAGGAPPVSPSCAEAQLIWSQNPDPTAVFVLGLAVDPDGNSYIIDDNGLLTVLSPEGKLTSQVPVPAMGAYRLAAGPGGRLLRGPADGSPTYRASRMVDGKLIDLWTLDAADLGYTSDAFRTRAAISGDGQFFITGVTPANGYFVVTALDDAGEVLWQDKQPASDTLGNAVAADSATGIVTFSTPQLTTGWDHGAAVWTTDYDPLTPGVGDMAVSPAGDTYLLGVNDAPVGLPFTVGRLSPEGAKIWKTKFPSNADESLSCGIAPLPDGGAMMCVGFEHGAMGIQRLTAGGDPAWGPTDWFAGDCGALGTVYQIAPSPDGAVVMATSAGIAKIAP